MKKRKPAQQREISPNAPKDGEEEGVCVLCGGHKAGVPARKDAAISAARRLRSLLGMPEQHTVACRQCLPLCLQKRAIFEREMKAGRMFAALFFIAVIAGGLYLGGLEAWLLIPAILGTAIILLLPYGKYFPAFDALPAARF